MFYDEGGFNAVLSLAAGAEVMGRISQLRVPQR